MRNFVLRVKEQNIFWSTRYYNSPNVWHNSLLQQTMRTDRVKAERNLSCG